MLRFKDKTVLITGCNRGLGNAFMKKFAEEGATIFAHARKPSEEFLNEIEYLKSCYSVFITPLYFDLTMNDQMKSQISKIKDSEKYLDILVNSAGVPHGGLFQMTSVNKVREVFDVNFFGAFELSQIVSKLMIRQKFGTIINIASILGEDTGAGTCAYGTSKAAIIALTKVMAEELAPFSIRVNAVSPGPTEVGMISSLEEKALRKQIENTALKRKGRAEEIAEAVLFLASDQASYITGQILRVDGGTIK